MYVFFFFLQAEDGIRERGRSRGLGDVYKRQRVNTALAISVKVVFLALALMGLGNLVLAIAADVGVTLLVIITSLRIGRFAPKVRARNRPGNALQ